MTIVTMNIVTMNIVTLFINLFPILEIAHNSSKRINKLLGAHLHSAILLIHHNYSY